MEDGFDLSHSRTKKGPHKDADAFIQGLEDRSKKFNHTAEEQQSMGLDLDGSAQIHPDHQKHQHSHPNIGHLGLDLDPMTPVTESVHKLSDV